MMAIGMFMHRAGGTNGGGRGGHAPRDRSAEQTAIVAPETASTSVVPVAVGTAEALTRVDQVRAVQ
jgi:hypothetical protein